jgi:RimJ/RimL family protein N-acetyltransferase
VYSLHQALQDALPLIERELRLDRLSADEHAVGLLAAANQEVFAWLPYPAPTSIEQMQRWIETVSELAERRIPPAVLVDEEVSGTTSYYPGPLRGHAETGSTWLGTQRWGIGLNTRTKGPV